MRHFIAVAAIAALGLLSMGGCASLPSVNDEGLSPRSTTLAAVETTIQVLDDVTIATQAGVMPDNLLDDIVQYMPKAADVATVYLDNTAACVVVDGALQTDPAAGGSCSKSAFRRAFRDLSATLMQVSAVAGLDTDTGRAVALAAILLRRQLEPASGDVWSGYQKVEDVSLEDFQAARTALAAARDRLVTAAQAALAAAG